MTRLEARMTPSRPPSTWSHSTDFTWQWHVTSRFQTTSAVQKLW